MYLRITVQIKSASLTKIIIQLKLVKDILMVYCSLFSFSFNLSLDQISNLVTNIHVVFGTVWVYHCFKLMYRQYHDRYMWGVRILH